MSTSKKIYKNLVFEGGGVKGAAYAGAMQVLDEHQLLEPIEQVAGTSAGAITATLLAVGAGSKGLTEAIVNTNFEDFIYDKGWIFSEIYRIFRCYGLHSGNGFVKVMKENIQKYAGNPNLTFAQLEEKIKEAPHKFKHLSIAASNITTQNVDVFNAERTPHIPIWEAVRCSMSLPLIFKPYVIKNNYYVDGGLGWVYPIDMYDTKKADGEDIINEETLGFYLDSPTEIGHPGFHPPKVKVNSLIAALKGMIGFLYDNSNARHLHPGDRKRTVFVNDLGISAADFGISKENVQRLIESGRKATESFLG
ncbi:MAG: patatin-like phospholipase family protein [Aureispira sp.]